ncbi:uncharacterized protein LOC142230903 [Haematobia irritans]|uniref:uncharacterized protein LOC142230903 n=1 Tax=Haematobia irritans TaxID=7368 RepID=UPI003F50A861
MGSKNIRNANTNSKNRVNKIEMSREHQEYILSVNRRGMSSIKKTIQIYGTPVEMEIDPGASHSIMSETEFRRKLQDLELRPCSTVNVRTNHNLQLCGEVDILVSTGMVDKKLTLLVIRGDGPALIGRNWFEELEISITSAVYKIGSSLPEPIMKFSSVFEDTLGDYSGNPIKLLTEKSSKPRFFRHRPVPFVLKDRIEEALKRMEDDGVLRPVTYSERATPIVAVIKPDGSIRICGDYKCMVNHVLYAKPWPTASRPWSRLHYCEIDANGDVQSRHIDQLRARVQHPPLNNQVEKQS